MESRPVEVDATVPGLGHQPDELHLRIHSLQAHIVDIMSQILRIISTKGKKASKAGKKARVFHILFTE